MILEGLVTTLGPEGRVNVAPMGPTVGDGMDRFVLRPFRSSTTYRNLKDRGQGVFHVTDDVLILARAAIGEVEDVPFRPAERVEGFILSNSCRSYEFRVSALDESGERSRFEVETVLTHSHREFFGFNRAKHAVLEAAILATRVDFLPLEGLASDLARFREIVGKTGGPRELEAFDLLEGHVARGARARGLALEFGRT